MKRLIKKASKMDDVREALENYGEGDFRITETKDGLSAEGVTSIFILEHYTDKEVEIDGLHVKIIVNEDGTVREFINLEGKWYEEKSTIDELIRDLNLINLFSNNYEVMNILQDMAYQSFIVD